MYKRQVRDPIKGNVLVSGASVILEIENNIYKFKEIQKGIYRYTFKTEEYEGFVQTHTLSGIIYITKQNFIQEKIELIIVIELEEIYPGIPAFYFINAVIMLCAIISVFIGYLKLKNKKLVNWSKNFIKKLKWIKKV